MFNILYTRVVELAILFMDFCILLRLYRRKAKISQKDLALAIGVSRQTVVNWELGKTTAFLSSNQWIELRKVLGCKVDDLLKD